MRSYSFFARLPLAAALAMAPFALNPVYAQDEDEVVYTPGTGLEIGDTEYAEPEYPDVGYDDADSPDYRGADSSTDDIAGKMSDPAMQHGVADSIERATAAMMNVPVGPFAAAIEGARPGTVSRRIRRDTRLGDLAGPDAAYLPEELAARSREMMGMMGGFARAMAAMMPEFERMSREMEDSFHTAKAEARRNY